MTRRLAHALQLLISYLPHALEKIMVGVRYYLVILGCAILVSCGMAPDPLAALAETSVLAPKEYKLLSHKIDTDSFELLEEFTLQISNNDYNDIINNLMKKSYFQNIKASESQDCRFDFSDPKYDSPITHETACWYDGKYYYQKISSDPNVLITVVFEQNKTKVMHIVYMNL